MEPGFTAQSHTQPGISDDNSDNFQPLHYNLPRIYTPQKNAERNLGGNS